MGPEFYNLAKTRPAVMHIGKALQKAKNMAKKEMKEVAPIIGSKLTVPVPNMLVIPRIGPLIKTAARAVLNPTMIPLVLDCPSLIIRHQTENPTIPDIMPSKIEANPINSYLNGP